MRAWWLIPAFLTGAGCRKAPSHPIQLGTYADLRHKVSFEYPAPWSLTRPLPSRFPGPDFGLRHPPSAVVSVVREDEPRLRESDFQAAEFVYAVRTGLPEAACALAAGPATVEVGGVSFHTGEVQDAGGREIRKDRVYSFSQGGNCFLFDLVLFRFSADAARPMTAREQGDLETEMTEILSSVSLRS